MRLKNPPVDASEAKTDEDVRAEYDALIEKATDVSPWKEGLKEDLIVLTVSTVFLFGVPFVLCAHFAIDVTTMIVAAVFTYLFGTLVFILVNYIENHNDRTAALMQAERMTADHPWLKHPTDAVDVVDETNGSNEVLDDAVRLAASGYADAVDDGSDDGSSEQS